MTDLLEPLMQSSPIAIPVEEIRELGELGGCLVVGVGVGAGRGVGRAALSLLQRPDADTVGSGIPLERLALVTDS